MQLHRIFFYLTLILLPTQLGYHFFPDWALVLGRRLDYLSPTFYITDICIIGTVLCWFFDLLHKSYFQIFNFQFSIFNKNFKFLISNFSTIRLFSYFIIFLFITINIILSSSPLIAISKWLKLLEFILFGLYIIKTKPSFSRSLWCLSFAIFYSSLIAIAQFFLQHSIGGVFWFLGERTFDVTTLGIARISIQISAISRQPSEMLRPYATFPHPNVLGGFLAVTLPLLIYKSTNNKFTNKKANIFQWITIVFGFLALILTFSRSAWIAFITLFILLKITCPPKHRRRREHFKFISNFKFPTYTCLWQENMAGRKISNIFILLLLLILLGFSIPYFQTLTPNNESIYVRNELNSAAISMWWSSSPNTSLTSFLLPRLFGVGLGNYLVELPKYYPHRDIFFLQPVHNIYLLVLSETGLIGLGITIYLLFYLFKTALHKRQFSIMHYALCIMLFIGLVDHYPITLQQGQLLLTILLAFSLNKMKNSEY